PRDARLVEFVLLPLPASDVAVNVQPTKLEVRFPQERRLYDRLRRLFQLRLRDSVAGATSGPPLPQASVPAVPAPPGRAVPMMWPAPATVSVSQEEPRPGRPTPDSTHEL